MVQLKVVQMRLKSVKNIQKITKTMKMVSASKFTKAERELRAARPFGYAPRKFYRGVALMPKEEEVKGEGKKDEKAQEEVVGAKKDLNLQPPPPKPNGEQEKTMYIAMTSDRGLCGGAHSGISRAIRGLLNMEVAPRKPEDSRLVCVGDKSRNLLKRQHAEQFVLTAKGIGRVAPTFTDASSVANAIMRTGYEYDSGMVFYNRFVSAVRYDISVLPLFSMAKVETAPNIQAYDEVEPDVVQSYTEFTLVASIYYALKQCAASEQSARVAAMDAATGNADDAIKSLTMLLNRTRQAVVTRELIEIISGAAALK